MLISAEQSGETMTDYACRHPKAARQLRKVLGVAAKIVIKRLAQT
jgi:hypothetical protein